MAKGKRKIFKRVILPIIILAVVLGAYFYFKGGNEPVYDFASVKRGSLVQEVSVTGNVKPAQDVDLAFERSGKIAEVYAKIGEQVNVGDTLVVLESSELSAKLAQAKASLKTEEANLEEYIRGTRLEEIAVKEAELKKAKQDLENYYGSVLSAVYGGYNKSDDAVRTQVDEMFTNDEISPILSFSTEVQTKINAEAQRKSLTEVLDNWLIGINSINANSSEYVLDKALADAKTNLISVRSFLDTMMDAVNNATTVLQATANAYKANINTARTNITTAISAVDTQTQNIASQKITVEKIQNELELLLAGKTSEEIAGQEAKVEQARANVLDYESQLGKSVLRSPIKGVVTKQDAKVGQIAVANASIVSIISRAEFQIETNVPEADISKIKLGNEAKVTLDAYGNDVVFETKVISIEPAETVIEGVATYKAVLQFNKEDDRVLSGMTANIDIITAQKFGVLTLPYRAVSSNDSGKFVSILGVDGKTLMEKKIEIGIRGTDGNIEIVSGLNEGEKVVIPSSS
jgi:multidrug efflux pump subunit AcrA (membrane-fusion protein)